MTVEDGGRTLEDDLADWYGGERPGGSSERYIVCAGLAVLEVMRDHYPIEQQHFLTDGNQVKTSGKLIQKILSRFGETRIYTREGGRTTRSTRPAAERLVERLNGSPAGERFAALEGEERQKTIDDLQGWLAQRVREYFDQKRIEVEIDLSKSTRSIVADILAVATSRRQGGAVAQHLVGAKLALRFPEETIANFSSTTADQQLGRSGDFVVKDAIFHVTMVPGEAVVEKCRENLKNGYRPFLVVPEHKLGMALGLAEQKEIGERVAIYSIEAFVSQNIEELATFGKTKLAEELREFLETYNLRVQEVETDLSLLIEIPENLVGAERGD